jgi:hypothetical protein
VNGADPLGEKAPDESMPCKAQVGLGAGALDEDETTEEADELADEATMDDETEIAMELDELTAAGDKPQSSAE